MKTSSKESFRSRFMIRLSLVFAGLITLIATAAYTSNKEGERMMIRKAIPPIDVSTPAHIKTATFALG